MDDESYLFAAHQDLLTQFLLLFRPRKFEPRENNYLFVFKTLFGRRYLVGIYHVPGPKARRWLIARGK